MKQAKELVQVLKGLTATQGAVHAIVTSVDKTKNSCEVMIDSTEIGGVRLQAVIDMDRKGCRLYPAIDSDVIIEPINDSGGWKVSLYSEIEQVLFEIGDMSLDMSANGIVLNGGQLGGMVKVDSLVSDLNAIKSDLKALKMVFKTTWNPTGTVADGTALKAAAATWAGSVINDTVKSDLENTKVKQ